MHSHCGHYSSGVTAFQACDEIWETPSALQQPRYKLSLRPGFCRQWLHLPSSMSFSQWPFQKRVFPVLALDMLILCTFAGPGPGSSERCLRASPHPGAACTAHSPHGRRQAVWNLSAAPTRPHPSPQPSARQMGPIGGAFPLPALMCFKDVAGSLCHTNLLARASNLMRRSPGADEEK